MQACGRARLYRLPLDEREPAKKDKRRLVRALLLHGDNAENAARSAEKIRYVYMRRGLKWYIHQLRTGIAPSVCKQLIAAVT